MESILNGTAEATDISSWNNVGDFLRDDSNRSSLSTKESLPNLIDLTTPNLKDLVQSRGNEELVLANLRVLINLTADNDYNRSFLLENLDFWHSVDAILTIENEAVVERMVIFLSQFIYSEKKQEYLTSIFTLVPSIPSIVEKLHSLDSFILLFKELVVVNEQQIVSCKEKDIYIQDINWFLSELEYRVKCENDQVHDEEVSDDDDDDEVLVSLCDIVARLTMFDDLDLRSINANYRVLKVMEGVSSESPNITHIKRKLFSASGNITSMKNYCGEIDMALEYFKNPNVCDSYVLPALAITLGNFVTSETKSQELNASIKHQYGMEPFFKKFFNMKVTDVIQIQSIHLLNNIVNGENVKYVLSNLNGFGRMARIIVDNNQYYPEMSRLFYKFTKKFITLEFINGAGDMSRYFDLWGLFSDRDNSDHQEIELLLLQAYIRAPTNLSPFVTKLITNAVTLNSNTSITIDLILQRLKTLGMFMHNLNSRDITVADLQEYFGGKENYVNLFLQPLSQLLLKLKDDVLEQSKSQPQYSILLNNSKFLCVSIIKFQSTGPSNDLDNEIVTRCKIITLT
jgi:hypothetical protein